MWDILYFEIVHKTKGVFLVWPLGGLYLAFQLSILEFGFSLLVLIFFLAKSVVGTLIQLKFNLSSLESLCKNKPPNIRLFDEVKKR